MNCPRCNSLLSEVSEKCYTCGYYLGAPNVRAAQSPEESAAVDKRYSDAYAACRAKGTEPQLKLFEEAVAHSGAVVNMSLNALYYFLNSQNSLYQSYGYGVQGQSRKVAEPEFDKHRSAVEGVLFGSYYRDIRYAALSIDGSGLRTYGAYSVALRDIALSERSTVLEENSFDFVQRHNLVAGKKPPNGYQVPWSGRARLAVAKHNGDIYTSTVPTDFPRVLLRTDGVNRSADVFMEVHIYGAFDVNAIAAVAGKSRKLKGADKALIAVVKERLNELGKTWVEHD